MEPPAVTVSVSHHALNIIENPSPNKLKQNHQFDHLAMPSEPYSGLTNSPIAKDTTIFIGIVVRGTLVVDVLKDKATELIEKWPVLGGKFVTKVLN